MGFRSVWPWRAAETIALEKNILSTLEPFPSLQSENWRGGGDWISWWRWQDANLTVNVPPVRL